ncbi:MAG: efflux RND transporter permease subunit [Candidatus Aureabacteria bacterium]|nr:efflux RND transporter permease subunit [Candidatus Auribacterota bacterium]
MSLPEFGVRKPVTNLMIFSGIIVIALYSLMNLGVDLMPEIEPPAITVISTYSGANPEDVETKVTEPLENQLATTPGLDKIFARCLEGLSLITLKFNWGTNLDEASNDIRDRIDRAKKYLPDIPDEMDEPSIFKFNTAMIPILFIGFSADRSYPDLYDIIDKRIVDELKQIPGVGTLTLQGGLQRQINIWIDRKRLEAYGFSILDIEDILKKENFTQPAGSVKYGLTDYLVRVPGEFATPAEINSVILGQRKGNLIYLKDVARVEDSYKEVTSDVQINRNPGLMMMIQKQIGSNSVQVSEKVKKRLAALMGNLPADVRMTIIMDTSHDIINSLNSLKSTVWQGGFFVILVVWFFLRRFIPSLIIALTIPFSLLIAFIYLFLSGRTINIVSLSSLTIAIGMVVDNAIVIVDNVYRHMERGRRPREAAIFGTSEMFLSVAASTATTVVVFLPMLFISGIVGIWFGELAITITVTLTASLFTAVTFSPMLCSKMMKVAGRKTKDDSMEAPPLPNASRPGFFSRFYEISERWFTSWESGYAKALAWCLARRKFALGGFTAMFLGSLLLIPFVGYEFAPEDDQGDIRATLQLPLGTRIEETEKVGHRVEDLFYRQVPELRSIFVRSGLSSDIGAVFGDVSGSHVISVGVKCVPKTERKRPIKEIANAVRAEVEKIPGIVKTNFTIGNPIGRAISGTGGKEVQVEVIGHSFADTGAVAEQIKAVMEKVPGAVDVSISRELKRPELRIEVNREKAAALGLNMRTIADTIKTYIEGSSATRYRESGDTYDIYVRLDEASRSKREDIEGLVVVSPFTQKQIKLASIARIYETVGPMEIERKNRERVLRVECNTFNRSTGKVSDDIMAGMKKIALPAGVTLNFGGQAEEQSEAFLSLTYLLILGTLLVYMVMAAQFESLLDPFVIMFAIPFTFTGAILAFVLTGTTLNVMSFLALVMLMGIVVNNAIVLVSYIIILRARGHSMVEAITMAGKDRLRPVLATTITTLVGLLPLAISRGEGSETWQPLGITMIGGLSVSTLITMLFVPTLYAVFETHLKKRDEKKKRKACPVSVTGEDATR